MAFNVDNGRAPFEFLKFLLTVLASSGLFLYWMYDQYKAGSVTVRFNKLLILFSVFVLVNGVSLLFSEDRFLSLWGSAGTQADAFVSLVSLLTISFVVTQYFEKIDDLKKLFWVILSSAVLVAVHGVFQYAGYDFSIFDKVNLDDGKAFSTLGLPGVFTTYLAIVSYLVVSLVLRSTHRRSLALLLSALFLLQVALYFSGARVSAILNLSGISIFLMYFFNRSKFYSYRKKTTVLSVVVFLAAIISLGLLPSLVVKKTKIFSLNKGSESRVAVWKNGLDAWHENKWLGSGPETFYIGQKKYETKEANKYEYWGNNWTKAHNQLIQFLVSVGIIGGCAFLLHFFYIFRKTFQLMVRPVSGASTYSLGLMAGAIFIFFVNLTAFNLILTEFYYFLFPSLVCAVSFRHETKKINFAVRRMATKGILFFLLMGSFYFSAKSFLYWLSDIRFHQIYDKIQAGVSGQEALELVDEPISIFPENAFYHCYKANVIFSLLMKEKSRLSPEKVRPIVDVIDESSHNCINIGPKRFEPYTVRGKIYSDLFLNDVLPDAVVSEESYLKFRELAGSSPVSYYEIGLLKLKQNNIPEFKSNMEKAIDLKADYLLAYYQLVKYFKKQGDWQALDAVLRRLHATEFYSGEFLGILKSISNEVGDQPEQVSKLASLYSKYEHLVKVKE